MVFLNSNCRYALVGDSADFKMFKIPLPTITNLQFALQPHFLAGLAPRGVDEAIGFAVPRPTAIRSTRRSNCAMKDTDRFCHPKNLKTEHSL